MLPELAEFEDIILQSGPLLRVKQHGEVAVGSARLPLYSASLGSEKPDAPVLGFFAGVHGLERIGSQVLLAFLRSLLVRLRWDSSLQRKFETIRLVFMPLVNPAGMALGTRSNAEGVDLMRNAPIDALEKTPFLLGGHRISPKLPWYRGKPDAGMARENLALCKVVQEELFCSPFSIALDCHSGFGLCDRVWFPYAYTRTPIQHLPEIHALKSLFDQTYPHHPYVIEPQARQYLTHGDVWDYLYQLSRQPGTGVSGRVFLPLTLELGSWLWIKKNPRQLLSLLGMFNPVVPHRRQRVLRGHLLLLEFLVRAVHDNARWLPDEIERIDHLRLAESLWYSGIRK
ncbi:M14 family zinc carboxypeptidase [Andreprevotia chitinilytica]|uniref:M14 family zinc carboxypeptidase n=1 Tax=Andreprevotia chitinilytica TaxID=396808 RepID=UPI0005561AA3|nr:DUF2817 domain-containing protein [Andreprevotia chitinilytica]